MPVQCVSPVFLAGEEEVAVVERRVHDLGAGGRLAQVAEGAGRR